MSVRALVVAVAILLLGSTATAAKHSFPVQMAAPTGEEPDVVCVLVEQARPTYATPVRLLGAALNRTAVATTGTWHGAEEVASVPAPSDLKGYEKFLEQPVLEACNQPAPAKGKDDRSPCAKQLLPRRTGGHYDPVWIAEQGRLTQGLNQAASALSFKARTPTDDCAVGPTECRPDFEVASLDESLVCQATSTFKQEGNNRVAMLRLTTPGAGKINVKELTVSGSLVVLDLDDVDGVLSPVLIGLRVVGGHYAIANETASIPERGGIVSLAPRCRTHQIRLPPVVADLSSGVKVQLGERLIRDSAIAAQCVGRVDATHTFPMRIPVAKTPELPQSLRAQAGSADMVAQWYGEAPQGSIQVHAWKLEFSWRSHCLHQELKTKADCPSVSLPKAAGSTCDPALIQEPSECGEPGECGEPAKNVGCRYVCSAAQAFELPTPMLLETKRGDSSWEDSLEYANQELRSFVALDQRELWVSLEEWERDPLPQDRVEYVELQGTFGGVHRVTPRQTGPRLARVPYPGLTCHDQLTYQAQPGAVGSRNYTPDVLGPLAHGVVRLRDPARSAHVLRLDASLGTGLSLGILNRTTNVKPLANAGLGLALEPYGSTVSGEVRADWLLGRYPGFGLSRDPPEPEYVWYNRVPLTAFLRARLSAAISLGLGGGITIARALNGKDEELSGGIYLPGHIFATTRYHLSTAASFDVFALILPVERIRSFETNFLGEPERKTTRHPTLLLGLRLNFLLNSGRLSGRDEEDTNPNATGKATEAHAN